jgi:hypothetical protein
MKTKKIEVGDIFEMATPKGMKIYLQCVEIPVDIINNVELIKVFYKLYKTTPEKINSIVEGGYFFNRFPLKAAYRKKIVEKVGNVSLPIDFEVPLFYRTENDFGEGWQIVNAKTWKRETVIELSDEQKKLSPWGGMNDTLIIELLERGWTLENWNLDNMFIE